MYKIKANVTIRIEGYINIDLDDYADDIDTINKAARFEVTNMAEFPLSYIEVLLHKNGRGNG